MKEFLVLKDFLLENKWKYVLGVCWLIAVDSLQLLTPKVLGWFTDALQENRLTRPDLLKYSAAVIGIALGVAFFRFLWRLYINGTARLLEYYLRGRTFAHLLEMPAAFFDDWKTGDLMARLTNDVEAVRTAFGMGVVMLVDSIFLTLLAATIMLATINVKLTLIALTPLPLMAFCVFSLRREIFARSKTVQAAFSSLTEKVRENISGIRVVKSFVQEENEIESFSQEADRYVQASMGLVKVQGVFSPLMQFLSVGTLAIGLVYGGMLVIRNTISLGDYVAFNSYLGMLVWPAAALGSVFNLVQRGSAAMARINEILGAEPEIAASAESAEIDSLNGRIEFRNVSFDYQEDGDLEIDRVSFVVEPGTTLGVIGRTGSGKSTLGRLLLRLYEVKSGDIFVDGYALKDVPIRTVRQKIGYVPQDGFLFSGSIGENIAFSREGATEEEIVAAAKTAGIEEEIRQFANGFDTVVGERGITLSGGQQQRVALARALLKDPVILVLDDSLSAVDADTEQKILNNLRQVRAGKTTLIISHRVSAVKEAEQIIVLGRGRVIECGTDASLRERQGYYRKLYERQMLERSFLAESEVYDS